MTIGKARKLSGPADLCVPLDPIVGEHDARILFLRTVTPFKAEIFIFPTRHRLERLVDRRAARGCTGCDLLRTEKNETDRRRIVSRKIADKTRTGGPYRSFADTTMWDNQKRPSSIDRQ